MMRKTVILIVLILLGLLISSVFIVQQGTQDILVRFGKVVTVANSNKANIYTAGLHFKLPFIDVEKVLPESVQTMASIDQNVLTKNKQNLVVNLYLKWQITNPYLFYLASQGGNAQNIQNVLVPVLNQLLFETGSQYSTQELIANTDKVSNTLETLLNNGSTDKDIMNILNFQSLLKQINPTLLKGINSDTVAALGIKVVGVEITKILPPNDQLNDIFSKMSGIISDSTQQIQTQAQQAADKTQAEAEQQASKIVGQAQLQAAKIRGSAEVASVKLYATAFKNETDFYAFIRALDVYEQSFDTGNNTVILTPKGHLLNSLNTSSQ